MMNSLDNEINQHFQDAIEVIQQHPCNSFYQQEYTAYYESLGSQPTSLCQISCCLVTHPEVPPAIYEWSDTAESWPQITPDVSSGHSIAAESPQFYSVLPPQKSSKGRKKLRLYEYLHEALNDPNMGDSIQWTDSSSGVFQFVSKNKEKLAECWGQRKGNRKTMTYQKMARALRNYSRTGEIMKVRRKLTYQFNPAILQRLGATHVSVHLPCLTPPKEARIQPQGRAEQAYCDSAPPDWHGWYGAYPLQEDYDLATSFTSQAKL